MKKILYMAAVLAVLAGCSKTEYNTVEGGERNISLSVAVDGETTRALYDGAGRIKFEKYDKFAGAIAKADDPGTAIKVATKSGYAASVYKSDFTIADETAESPVFRPQWFTAQSRISQNGPSPSRRNRHLPRASGTRNTLQC